MFLEGLPAELLHKICGSHLALPTLLRVHQCCRRICAVGRADFVWRLQLCRVAPIICEDPILSAFELVQALHGTVEAWDRRPPGNGWCGGGGWFRCRVIGVRGLQMLVRFECSSNEHRWPDAWVGAHRLRRSQEREASHIWFEEGSLVEVTWEDDTDAPKVWRLGRIAAVDFIGKSSIDDYVPRHRPSDLALLKVKVDYPYYAASSADALKAGVPDLPAGDADTTPAGYVSQEWLPMTSSRLGRRYLPLPLPGSEGLRGVGHSIEAAPERSLYLLQDLAVRSARP